jgi:hypothetical protein
MSISRFDITVTSASRRARHDAQPRGVARGRRPAVERQFQHVGRLWCRRAHTSRRGRWWRRWAAVRPRPPARSAPSPPARRSGPGVGGQRHRALGHAGAGGDRLPVPVAVELIPLIARLDPVQGPARGPRPAQVGADGDDRKRASSPSGTTSSNSGRMPITGPSGRTGRSRGAPPGGPSLRRRGRRPPSPAAGRDRRSAGSAAAGARPSDRRCGCRRGSGSNTGANGASWRPKR